MIRLQVGQRIKELRMLREMSQEGLAFEAGLDRTYIAGVENGRRNISIINLAKIWKALGTTGKEFFDAPIFCREAQ